MKKNNQKGFTLAELLIVVAIIAVLVAIAIPTFSNQLESSREAVDIANMRAAYAEAMAEFLTRNAKNNDTFTVAFSPKQSDTSKWKIDTSQLPFALPTGLASTTKYIVFTKADSDLHGVTAAFATTGTAGFNAAE